MADRGLHTSRWAHEHSGNIQRFHTLGDWVCPSCDFVNFQRRTECFRCKFLAGSDAYKVENKRDGPVNEMLSSVEPHHQTATGGNDRFTQNDLQANGAPGLTEDFIHQIHGMKNDGRGLITSRWAPRKLNSTSKMPDNSEIWTRVIVPSAKVMQNSDEPKARSPSSPIALDLGLPYEVQHYILSLIQRILEEACFDFASRWMPATLASNNWTCAEAVELSTWRKVLPSAPLPSNALTVLTRSYSLDEALADAVKIRNAAVHRHLCSTIEIRRMTAKAEELMAMFADRTRQSKFQRLGEGLEDWDREIGYDEQMRRKKLQEVLQETSERPMDDMDWTPNEVSLREIVDGTESLSESDETYWDKMELD